MSQTATPTQRSRRTVSIWYASIDAGTSEPSLREAVLPTLSDDELERLEKLRVASARMQFLAGRTLLRTALARNLATNPTDIRFAYEPLGKPRLDNPSRDVPFNLAHTNGMVVAAIADPCPPGVRLGIDVEPVDRKVNRIGLAERFFAPSEVSQLRAAPAAEQEWLFLRFWTLKESYLKACGSGLATPLDAFAFDLSTPRQPRIAFQDATAREAALRWSFLEIEIGRAHLAALAIGEARPQESEEETSGWEVHAVAWPDCRGTPTEVGRMAAINASSGVAAQTLKL